MSLLRSPTGSGTNIGRSGSQPNLCSTSAIATMPNETSCITFRKRKHPEETDVQSQLKDIQKQMTTMMEMLTKSIDAQNESATNIRNDIAFIKEEMFNIKIGMGLTEEKINKIVSEQTDIKAKVENIVTAAKTTEAKICSLESDIEKIKLASTEMQILPNKMSLEEILIEINNQNTRKKNVILSGIKEPQSNDHKERQTSDKVKAFKIIKQILENCPEPSRVMRIGKYKPDVNRSIKVTFESEETTKLIFRNKNKLTDTDVKIFPDQTPYQQTFFKKLKEELNRRTANGEGNLKIKYIKGVPQIISTSTKN